MPKTKTDPNQNLQSNILHPSQRRIWKEKNVKVKMKETSCFNYTDLLGDHVWVEVEMKS